MRAGDPRLSCGNFISARKIILKLKSVSYVHFVFCFQEKKQRQQNKNKGAGVNEVFAAENIGDDDL